MLIVVAGESSQKLYSCANAGATSSSQNAAALLIDLGTVDIRRVGIHCSGYSKWGVPSKIIGRRVCSAHNDESRPSLGRKRHEGSHQGGGLGSARAYAGGDGDARHRQHLVLRALVRVALVRVFVIPGWRFAHARPRIPVPGSVLGCFSWDRPRMTNPTISVS